jgi:ATPase subunit of ABC transporter with duplicated ATPase domains
MVGLLLEEPDFLMLDEPTNHLDLAAREFVYELVASWKKGLIVVSHDVTFLEEIGIERVVEL